MRKRLIAICIASFLVAENALTDESCDDPSSDWKPRDALRHNMESQGWKVQRIKVNDGCYDVKGSDRIGNRFEAKYSPSSLKIRELKIIFDAGGSASDYLDKKSPHENATSSPATHPKPAATN